MNKQDSLKFEYSDENLNHVAFPLGGIGAGMICIEGTGAISNVSLRHKPEIFNEPLIFSALTIKKTDGENLALILESQVPKRKIFGSVGCGGGLKTSYGLPRFTSSYFSWGFPFAKVALTANDCPIKATILAWSPFLPGDADNSSLPVAALEFSFENLTDEVIEAVYSFNSDNFMAKGKKDVWGGYDQHGVPEVKKTDNGFILMAHAAENEPWNESYFKAFCDDPETEINPGWFRGGGFDALTMTWKDIISGECPCRPKTSKDDSSPGASLYVPFKLNAGETKKITLKFAWYVPHSNLSEREDPKDSIDESRKKTYKPWYAENFKDIAEISNYWQEHYSMFREKTKKFSDCLYSSSLPEELTEAVSANLAILKSPTVLRQYDGKLWAWEGCHDNEGSCFGSCTHVWNYAQALPHLFPSLERSLRQTEFNESLAKNGHQAFRAAIPIGPTGHAFHAASDGQLGGIMKIYREWRISSNTEWLKSLWSNVKLSLDYCIETWDPDHLGVLVEPHHNTYDIEFWGADGMCSSFYIGALKAAVLMGEALGDNISDYQNLYEKGRKYLESELYNGEYFIQKIQWEDLKSPAPHEAKPSLIGTYSSEARELLQKEGPKYQYGDGCLSDGVIGAWMAEVCGIGEILDPEKVKSHLLAVHKYNLKHDLSRHTNPQRPGYAIGNEGGLLLCTWPRGGALSLPFIYSNEVWTGIEYQVASHLMMFGCVKEGMEIVEILRKRYDGTVRNPFDEYECGHWYARAMASYALLQGMTGIRYDAVEKVLYIAPKISGDFSSFLSTETGYGLAGIKNGKAFLDVIEGKIKLKEIIRG